jgi:hypothetical protein
MFRPQRATVTRIGNDNEPEQPVSGLVAYVPSVGESLQLLLETGKMMRTSPVTRIEHDGSELVVDTRNSRYRVKLAS